MQLLEPSTVTDIHSYSDESGHYIRGHLIDTRLNGNNWRIKPPVERLTKILNEQVPDKDFMIDAKLLAERKDAHYYGNGTKEDIMRGYAEKSHGKYQKVLGPFSYNDGTDDVYYEFIAKLHNSKAAAALMEHGSKSWIPFSHSAHIWQTEGPDWEITDFEFLGGALVDRGAYGPDAVISKMCKGTAPVCTKSLSASKIDNAIQGVIEDEKTAKIITSLVSKAASIHSSMSENIPNAVSNAPIPVAELKPEPSQSQPPVNQITITAEQIQKIKDEAIAKSELVWKEKVTALETKDKINTLNLVWAKVKDPTVKEALIKKYQTLENVDIVKEIADDVLKNLSTEEEKKEEEKPVAEEPTTTAKKSKSASLELAKEPDIPEVKESKTASQQTDNPAQLINRFIMGGKVQ